MSDAYKFCVGRTREHDGVLHCFNFSDLLPFSEHSEQGSRSLNLWGPDIMISSNIRNLLLPHLTWEFWHSTWCS